MYANAHCLSQNAFCERQWALAYMELQWKDNVYTVEGNLLHEKVDDPEFFESRGDMLISRSVPLISYSLGLQGIADMVEFHAVSQQEEGLKLEDRHGKWRAVPVEYKRGKPKPDARDEVQLCAQAICLEEMLNTHVPSGYIYYGQTRHRVDVVFDGNLRETVNALAAKMHEMFKAGYTPKAVFAKHCKNCSLVELCMPKLCCKEKDVKHYIEKHLSLEADDN